jgi:hypothetical protein
MAREANLAKYGNGLREGVTTFIDALKRFEALARADERKDIALLVEQMGIDGFGTLAIAAAIRARGNT